MHRPRSRDYVEIVRASRDYVEICPGEPMLVACLDEPVASGEEDPAAGLIGLDGKLVAPARFRGCRVTEVRDDWNLYGPVQPSRTEIILRTPWPEDVRRAAETVAGQDLPEDLQQRIWNAVQPAASGAVSTGAREAA